MSVKYDQPKPVQGSCRTRAAQYHFILFPVTTTTRAHTPRGFATFLLNQRPTPRCVPSLCP
eukprot:1586631-Pyramimonas_sp.AAC.1